MPEIGCFWRPRTSVWRSPGVGRCQSLSPYTTPERPVARCIRARMLNRVPGCTPPYRRDRTLFPGVAAIPRFSAPGKIWLPPGTRARRSAFCRSRPSRPHDTVGHLFRRCPPVTACRLSALKHSCPCATGMSGFAPKIDEKLWQFVARRIFPCARGGT